MKIQVTQENLQTALNIVSRLVGNRTTLPVLGNVLLVTTGNRLKLAATNLEMGVTCHIGAKVEAEGSITLPARLLSEYISNLPGGTVALSVAKATAALQSGSFNSKINGISAEEFPSIPSVEAKTSFMLPAEQFAAALAQVVRMASSDDSRPVLAGVYLHAREGFLYAAATDSYRLAEKRVMEFEGECAVIVPARTISELLHILDGSSQEKLSVNDDAHQISFALKEVELVSRLIDGQFPDYRQLIPETVPTTARLKAAELRNVTKITSLFARENAGSVIITVGDKELRMGSVASQVGENSSAISAKISGEGLEVSLNGRYISDALSVIGTEEIDFGFTSKTNPCVLRLAGDDSYIHIIMPLRS